MRIWAKIPHYGAYPLELKTVGDHIRKKRMDLGLTVQETANLLNVSKPALGCWERDEHEIRIRFYPRIIEFLGYIPFEIGEGQGERLLAYRKIRGLSQEELRKEWNVERGSIQRWEGGALPRKKGCQNLLDGIADRLIEELGLQMYSEFEE